MFKIYWILISTFLPFLSAFAQTSEELRDIKGIKDFQNFNLLMWILIPIVFFIFVLFFRKFKNRQKVAPKKADTPIEVLLLRELEELEKTSEENPEILKNFHFSVSSILRRFVEEKFQFQATDLTTQEIRERVKRESILNGELESEFLGFLEIEDQIKFSLAPVTLEQSLNHVSEVKSFLKLTQDIQDGDSDVSI